MAGHMGDERVTQRGLTVVEVDAERNLLLIAGAVPGAIGGVVEIQERVADGRARLHPSSAATAKAKLVRRGVRAGAQRQPLVHEVVTAELAARRQGTHATKTRGLVAGGRAKPWRQKGTGRARQGTTRAPQWTGGGVVFGPHPRNYTGKVNRKAHVKALRIALSAHATGGTLAAIDARRARREPRTKAGGRAGRPAGASERPLVVVVTPDEDAAARSFRNLDRTHVVDVGRARGRRPRVGALAGRSRRPRWRRWREGSAS